MEILFIDNGGGGYAGALDVKKGTTLKELFAEQIGEDENPENHLIRVNRDIAPAGYVLKEDDRVTITPIKIEGGM